MVDLARTNAGKLGFENVSFRLGDIEDLPIRFGSGGRSGEQLCAQPRFNKHKVFQFNLPDPETGRFSPWCDIVLEGELPPRWKSGQEMYAGCCFGAIQKKTTSASSEEAGLSTSRSRKTGTLRFPTQLFGDQVTTARAQGRVASIWCAENRPETDSRKCCDPGSGCC